LRTLITDPQVSVAVQQQVNTWHTCLLHVTWQARRGHDNHVTYTSRVTQEHSQKIARLHVASYFWPLALGSLYAVSYDSPLTPRRLANWLSYIVSG
jgi:hypothetical protein